MKIKEYKLIACTPLHIELLRTWCVSKIEIERWAGPNFRYPHNFQSFLEDLKLEVLPSYVLINENEQMIAFGQFYERLQHCHLGRLVVNPIFRRQGAAKVLIEELSKLGKKSLNLCSLSLFVLSDNKSALSLYKSLGFVEKDYPEKIPLENCLYLTKSELAL